MLQNKTTVTAQWVAKTFNDIFWDKFYIDIAETGLDKDMYKDFGIDSLDCLNLIDTMNSQFGIQISIQKKYVSPQDLLNACLQALVSAKRLPQDGGTLVKTQYAKSTNAAVASHTLSDKYTQTVTSNQKTVSQLKQYQK